LLVGGAKVAVFDKIAGKKLINKKSPLCKGAKGASG